MKRSRIPLYAIIIAALLFASLAAMAQARRNLTVARVSYNTLCRFSRR